MNHAADKPTVSQILPKAPIQTFTRPIRRFLAVESSSGLVLAACTLLALILANSPLAEAFHHFWETPVRTSVGPAAATNPFHLETNLHFWVNDVLMTLFFFVVGLEIKRELVAGELSSVRKAALPAIAALGGMLAPAGVYLLLSPGGSASRGWGIPMATDIAFVVGVMVVLGNRVPFGLKVFLLALAIADDIGAIVVIAAAYSGSPNWEAVATAAFWLAATYGLNRAGVRAISVYAVIGVAIWLAFLRSGIHPTIAGVIIGLMTPTGAWVGRTALRLSLADLLARLREDGNGEVEQHDLALMSFAARESISPLERLEAALHPWVGFVIMPLFALANAGVVIRLGALADPVAIAVAAGLVIGKPIGIFGFTFAAVKLGIAELPTGITWRHLAAGGCLGGIGFTMSLFVAGLALPGEHLDAGKIGILVGSITSAIIGSVMFSTARRD